MKIQTQGAAMNPSTSQTELSPSTQLRKTVFGGSHHNLNPKSEVRSPNQVRRPKSEGVALWLAAKFLADTGFGIRLSEFGLGSALGFRTSEFGLNPNSEMENHGRHGRMRGLEANLAAKKSSAPPFPSSSVSVCSVSSVVSTSGFELNPPPLTGGARDGLRLRVRLRLSLNSEVRNPMAEPGPNSEDRNPKSPGHRKFPADRIVTPSGFGLRTWFGFRTSEFGLRAATGAALLALLLGAGPGRVSAADSNALVTAWLDAQTNIHSWSADFVQTRSLRALAQPLVATGRVWFAAPNLFHWELGRPAQTIAVRQPDQLLLVYPRLKRVEKFPLGGDASGPWRDALALFEAGFPRSRAELESRFNLLSIRSGGGWCEVALEPKSAAARRLMPEFRITFTANTHSLRATELKFADGSTMRNDFTNAALNPPVDAARFRPEIPAGFKVVQPANGAPR